MQPEFIHLSHYRLQKSRSDLEAAKILLEQSFHDQALNRSYYAIFHATRALLALDGFDSRKHSGIIAYFNQQYVATGILEKKYSKILMGAEKFRNYSDYDDFFRANPKDVEKQIDNAEIFLTKIEEIIALRLST